MFKFLCACVFVKLTVSDFHQWNNIAGHVVPIILALWFGNWSDRRGRKLPLIIGLCGKVIYSGMVIVNSAMINWDLYMIIYTASLPMGMLGGDVAIFACCFSYISDVSSAKQRTLRVTILDVVYLSTMPTGTNIFAFSALLTGASPVNRSKNRYFFSSLLIAYAFRNTHVKFQAGIRKIVEVINFFVTSCSTSGFWN